MQLSIKNSFQNDLRQIEALATAISEGIIVLDAQQKIVWANDAACAMHGVAGCAGLGQTIDDYHALFQVRFRSAPRAESAAAAGAERLRDTLMEVNPPGGEGHSWLTRSRKLPIPDETGVPRYILLVLTPVSRPGEGQGRVMCDIETAPGAAAILRCQDGAVVASNPAARRLLRLDGARCPSRQAAETLIAASAEPDLMRRHLAGSVAFSAALASLPEPDGEAKPALVSGQPAQFGGEACLLLNIVPWDALRPAVAAAARRDAATLHAFATGLCAAAPGPAYVLDKAMRVVAASKPWFDWLGYSAESATGHVITDFMTPPSAAHFADQTWATLASGGVVRDHACQFIKRTGEIAEALISAHGASDDDGNLMWAVVMTTDVTDKQRSDDRFSSLFALSPAPLLIRRMDDNRLLDANDAFIALTGYSAGAVIGHCADELWHFAVKSQQPAAEHDLRAGKRVQSVAVKIKTASGETLDGLLWAERVHMFGQACVLLAFQDVTDRRRNEAELFSAIETVMQDTTWFSQAVIEKLAVLRRPARPGAPVPEINDLTPREREVLGLISHGMTDTDIAEKLGLTRCTVRNHVATLYSKIGVHSRSSAIVWARERGVNLAWPLQGPANFMRQPAAANRKLDLPAKTRRP
jgi:PAS domain S-box-containing protein